MIDQTMQDTWVYALVMKETRQRIGARDGMDRAESNYRG